VHSYDDAGIHFARFKPAVIVERWQLQLLRIQGGDHEVPKRNVQLAFDNVLKVLDTVGREPNEREALRLVSALGSMVAGKYALAANEIMEVTRTIANRRSRRPGDGTAQVTKEMLRSGLTHVRIHL
jgi:hypothetical protein